MVPIIGLDNSECEDDAATAKQDWTKLCGEGTFAATQPERLVRIIAKELGVHDCKLVESSDTLLADPR